MQPTDKRIATVEQWQALKGVIDGNIGKARELTTDDYNWPTSNPSKVALWLLDDGVYSFDNLAVQYTRNISVTTSGLAIVKKATISSGTGDGQVIYLPTSDYSLFIRQLRTDGSGGTMVRIPTLANNLTTTSPDYALDARQGKVLKDMIDTETADRQTADTNLQSQIDAISAGSDVTDIVGTKADLNNYDTTTLSNNDIIKVLADESEGGATTYYRWSTTTSTFALIGEEGPYYTKTQADALLADKQDTLTAGANVTISNNTISATDTTYTAGTGIDITNGIISTTGGGGPTVVQTTGTSTTDVMSQNAVTSMVYADPATRNHFALGNNAVNTSNNGGTAIGGDAQVSAAGAIAIGGGWNSAIASGSGAIRMGGGQYSVSGRGAISLGYFTPSNYDQGKIEVGTAATDYGYNSSNYRLLTGLYDPQNAHDAATKGYVDTAVASAGGAAEINSTDWSNLWQ